MVDKQFLQQEYYHGLLPREDIKSLLRSNGDFVVTVTESVPGQPQEFVLSVMMQPAKGSKRIRHYTYKQVDGKVCIDTQTFDSIVSSIDHFLNKGESVIESGDKVILRTPISRCDWELTQEEIEITKKLGEGAFGEVSLGKLSRKSSNEVLNVAIKSSKLKALTKDQVSDIMYEARIMRMFEHPNVIKIHGVSALKEPIMLVLELASDGALDSYLRKNTVSVQAKGEMCCGASFGLEYLHHVCNVIHRDIAARNCLYSAGQVKISDFGLTRKGSSYQMTSAQRLPIKWMSPELLMSGLYTRKSDVFAFGVLVYEIYSNGGEPYPGMNNTEVQTKVLEGYRMELPSDTSGEVVELVTKHCWDANPEARFSMAEVAKTLEKITGVHPPKKSKGKTGQTTTEQTIDQTTIDEGNKNTPTSKPKSRTKPSNAKQLRSTETREQTVETPVKKSPAERKKASSFKKRSARKKKTRG